MTPALISRTSWAFHLVVAVFLTGFASAQDQPLPTGWQNPDAQPAPAPVAAPAVPDSTDAPEGPDPQGAVAAMLAIDPKYANGIVTVTGPGGSPVPKQWIIEARDSNSDGTLHKITVEAGQVISDGPSLNAYEALRQKVRIEPPSVQVDSGQAFFIAQPIAAANSQIIGRADYALTVRAEDSAPIWTVNCFDMNGGYIGKVILLATTGSVIETPGFRNAPPVQP